MRRARLWLVGVVCVEILACTSSSTGPSVGTVSGTVASSLGGGINAATVVITPTGGSALPAVQTTASGTYSVASVPDGSGSVAVSGVPGTCTTPSAASYSGLRGADTVTANVTVTCTASAPFGALSGTVTSNLGGVIADVTVTATPLDGTSPPAAQTNGFGIYLMSPVPDGSGTVALSTLPPNCTTPSPASYGGVTEFNDVTVDVTVMCTAPVAPFGTVTGTVSGGNNGNAGFRVVVTPAGDSALTAVTTDANGNYTVPNVPVGGNGGAGSVVARGGGGAELCGGGSVYTALAGGGTATVAVTVSCVPSPVH